MSTEALAVDCPLCLSTGTISGGKCELCEAAFDDGFDGAVDLPPASPSDPLRAPLRFSDVIEGLQRVGSLVSSADGALELEAACSLLQVLLESLRDQFLTEVVVGPQPKRPVT